MSTRYARLRPQMTADEAISYLRRQARDKLETIYVAYVLDPEQRLLGVVSFRDLFAAEPKKTVADIMETDVVRVTDEMDQETVSRIFAEHDLNVIPVVDADGRMKGIVTVDDIVDVVQEEATEDAQKFGGMAALELPYLQSSRREMIKKRGRLARAPARRLDADRDARSSRSRARSTRCRCSRCSCPMIVSTGGNSGSQASTLVIRAMALGEVRAADWWLILRRELLTGLALGAVLGVLALGARRALGRRGARTASTSCWSRSSRACRVVGCVLCGHARRLDAAVRAAQARRRSRERLGAVRRDARRRQRDPDLLRDREPDPDRRPAVIACTRRRCSPRASITTGTRRRSSSASRSCASRG